MDSDIIYKKEMTRSFSLFACEYWDRGERIELPRICEGTCFFEPLFVRSPNEGVSVWYNYSDERQDPVRLGQYFSDNPDAFRKHTEQYLSICDTLAGIAITDEPSFDNARTLFDNIARMWPMLAIVNLLGGDYASTTSQKIARDAYDIRARTDTVVYEAGSALRRITRQLVPEEQSGLTDYMRFEEIMAGGCEDGECVERRAREYRFFKGGLFTRDELFAYRYPGITLEDSSASSEELTGRPAMEGRVTGKAVVIFESDQLDNVTEGDILVTPMTTPDFLPAMKRAAAFVTDEGGITCHAAIVAREMGKPCVIGTGNATASINTGDHVEVDADSGVVRLISK